MDRMSVERDGDKMKRRHAIGMMALLLGLVLEVSCMVQPTPSKPPQTLSPTPSPTDIPTPTLSPTPTLPTLPRAVVDRVGIGLRGNILKNLAGIENEQSDPPPPVPTEYRIAEGGVLRVGFIEGSSRIMSIDVIGTPEDRSVRPRPDPEPIEDFVVHLGTYQIKMGDFLSASELVSVFGTPVEDTTKEESGEPYGDYRLRTIRFTDTIVLLFQSQDTEEIDQWRLWRLETTSSGVRTPRGFRLGMTFAEILERIATGTFSYEFYGAENPTEMWLQKSDALDSTANSNNVVFTFTQDVVTMMVFEYEPA